MGGKNTREVYDFLMSMDYGVCYGPVDAINQVWVKDKPIWCGRATERQDVEVNQPDAFGGDNAEGGAVGMVEFYPGADDQVSSEALASRFGLTPATMPGYRGLCHLFFRGFTGRTGFRWSSNNPYLPATKVAMSRMPRTLGAQYAEIWPFDSIDEDTGEPASSKSLILASEEGATVVLEDPTWYNTAGNFATSPPRITDLFALGLTQSRIDLGGTKVSASASGRIQNTLGNALSGVAQLGVYAFGALPGGGVDYSSQIPIAPVGSGFTQIPDVDGNFTIQLTDVVIPPGARYIGVRGNVVPNLSIFSQVLIYETESEATIPTFEWKHCRPDGTLGTMPDANPAHIIHECLVNAEWGMGENPALIDATAFGEAAETLYNEGFGLSMKWMAQTEVESFIQEVLDHVKASCFKNPATGLWEIKLLRADYDVNALLTLGPSNCKVVNGKRRAWGETVNEINVSYTDPASETEATVTSHNLANIQIQGGIVSETRNYYGIRNRFLAKRVADRDVLEAGYPVWTGQIEVDRSMWAITPASVFKLDWPEDGITGMVVRVMRVNYGSPRDRKIVLDVAEDIFALEQTQYVAPQTSLWVNDAAAPEPMTVETPVTAPLPILVNNGFPVEDVDADYPGAAVILMADHDTIRPLDIEAHAPVTLANGSTEVRSVATFQRTKSAILEAALTPEASSVIPAAVVDALFLGQASPGDLLMLGIAEADSELVMLDTFDSGAGEWSVIRGVYDTVPADWPVGTRAWAFPTGGTRFDPTERAGGEVVSYRFLMRTETGRLPLGQATPVDFTVSERPHLPFRPANVQLDGQGFGGVSYTDPDTNPATVTATWANRNRTIEDQTALRWADATVAGEVGQTTTLRITDDAGVVATEYAALAGTSYDIPFSALSAVGSGFVEFWAEKDGLMSFQAAKRPFVANAGGYGQNYGVSYG